MGNGNRKLRLVQVDEPVRLFGLIHERVRVAIAQVVREELDVALGAAAYERVDVRHGYRNGSRSRMLVGPTGLLELTVPRATLFAEDGEREWASKVLPRYQRRLPEINDALVAACLSGANTRRIQGALRPLLKAAALSKGAVSRVVGTLKSSFDAWRQRSLAGLEVVYLYLDAIALRVRIARKVVSTPVLTAVAVLADGQKQLLSLEMCGSESNVAWKGFLDDLVARGLPAPLLCIMDGNPGLRRALELVWPKTAVQRCAVHKLRNMQRKAPKHAQGEIADDFHKIVYAKDLKAAEAAREGFRRKWEKLCPGVVRSLDAGGDELLTFYRFPEQQWKTIRTTNVIERLNGEFRRRVKTQASLPTEDAALVLLFSLVASGQIKLRKLDGFEKMAPMLVAAARLPTAA
ncbi:MAG TPA: IS256 family transposase [Anaeromyxobacter sp.]|nr:IS256 family transposase [Anaeromyxobacter sp.]